MNPPKRPLSDRDLDELLSADLDGELDRAAAAFGLSADEAREAVADPRAQARRAALAGAARLVAAPVELPPGTADRLVTEALAASREENELDAARRRRERRADTARRVLVAAGSVAAVIAVIVGLAHLSTTPSGSDSKASSAVPPTESTTNAGAYDRSVAFGDVSTQQRLRDRVRAELQQQLRVATAPERTAEPSAPPPTALAPSFGEKSADSASAGRPRPNAACAAVVQRAAGSAPVLSGTGSSAGRPVSVFVFRRPSGYAVFVTNRRTCAVIARTTVP
jgi:hypothetical protein